MVAVLLAVTITGTGVGGEEQMPIPTGDVEQLRGYAASLVQQIEELRAEIARLARERDEMTQQLVEARRALETLKDGERRRLGKKAQLERASPEPGVVATDVKTTGEAHPARTAPLGPNGPPSGEVTDSQPRIETLEAELRELREREQANRANARNLEQALDVEKRAGQSKLEALQSVLQNTRSASTQLREELEETRRHNTELSQQVSALHARRDASPRSGDQAQAALAQGSAPDTKPALVPRVPPRKPKPVLPTEQANKTDGATPNTPELAVASAQTVEDTAVTTDLREELSVERERRQTLEEEVKRLTATGSSDEKFTEVWNALQSARSEILVLSNQLAEERKSREDLEVALARTQLNPAATSNSDLAKRLAQTLTDRRSEADRLAAQLKDANEIIVRLKGRLEASGSPEAESKMLTELQRDNETLRSALKAAEEANDGLREKAEMAQRLAEMVYGKGP